MTAVQHEIPACFMSAGSVLQFLKDRNKGLAAKKMQERLNMVLARRTGKDGRM